MFSKKALQQINSESYLLCSISAHKTAIRLWLHAKSLCKYTNPARNGVHSGSMARNSGKLVRNNSKLNCIAIIKIFTIGVQSQPFHGRHMDFTSFLLCFILYEAVLYFIVSSFIASFAI